MTIRSLGIIGYGAFGAFTHTLVARFAPDIKVLVSSEGHPESGAPFASFEEACAADVVVFAVPIHAFKETLERALPLLRQDTIIVDVATVKVHTAQVLHQLASTRPYIATHPMFGPESYIKTEANISGYRIVVAEHTLPGEAYDALRSFLTGVGFTVVEITADEHDRQLARTLFLTHFIGQVISKAGFGRTSIDTVSFDFLIKAVEIVKVNTELFQDVFRFNPYCEEVLKQLEGAEGEVHNLLRRSVA